MLLKTDAASTPSCGMTIVLVFCLLFSLTTFDLHHNHSTTVCTEESCCESEHDGKCPVCELSAAFKAVDLTPEIHTESDPVSGWVKLPVSAVILFGNYEPQSERAPPASA